MAFETRIRNLSGKTQTKNELGHNILMGGLPDFLNYVSGKGASKLDEVAGIGKGNNVKNNFDTIDSFYKKNAPVESKYREDQNSLIHALQQRINGQTPSMADTVANQQRQAGLNQMLAQQRSMRGVNPAMQARNMNMNTANMNAQIQQQAQTGNLQEQLNNQGMLAQALAQARGQDQAFQQMNQQRLMQQAADKVDRLNAMSGLNAQIDKERREGKQHYLNPFKGQEGAIAGGAMAAFA